MHTLGVTRNSIGDRARVLFGGIFLVPHSYEAREYEKIRYEGTEDQIVDDAKNVDKPDEDEGQQTLWKEKLESRILLNHPPLNIQSLDIGKAMS